MPDPWPNYLHHGLTTTPYIETYKKKEMPSATIQPVKKNQQDKQRKARKAQRSKEEEGKHSDFDEATHIDMVTQFEPFEPLSLPHS